MSLFSNADQYIRLTLYVWAPHPLGLVARVALVAPSPSGPSAFSVAEMIICPPMLRQPNSTLIQWRWLGCDNDVPIILGPEVLFDE